MNDRLLNAFLAGSIDEPTLNAKQAALRNELALIETSLARVATVDVTDVRAALAVFEFSQKKGNRARFKEARKPFNKQWLWLVERYWA